MHVLNAPSPAATASLAIGREVANRLLDADGLSSGHHFAGLAQAHSMGSA